MAKEIKAYGLSAGVNYFATVQNTAGNYWTGTGNNFAAASGITWSAAGIALTADATITRDYAADFPTAITSAGRYIVKVYSRAGGSPVVGDVQGIPAAKGLIEWDGTAELLLGIVVTNRDKTGYALGSAEHLLIGNDVLDAMISSHIAAGSVGAKINSGGTELSDSGTLQVGSTSTTANLATTASAVDSYYVGQNLRIVSGVGAGQSRIITGYVGSTKVATVDRAWATTPTTSGYAVIGVDSPATIILGGVPMSKTDVEAISANVASVILSGGLLNVITAGTPRQLFATTRDISVTAG